MPTLLYCSVLLIFLSCTQATMAAQQDAAQDDAQVQETESGLKYKVLKKGDGDYHPQLTDTVTVHYTGKLTDGRTFDSSIPRGEPTEFKVGQVIQGWNEGLGLMTVGAKYEFTIPSELGYGAQGSPPAIPPNATLIFEVELLDVKKGPGLPEFQKPDAEKGEKTESGLVIETLTKGEGEPEGAGKLCILNYTCWTPEGELLESSLLSGRPLKAAPEQLSVPMLQEAMSRMAPGSTILVRSPYEKAFPQRPHPRLEEGSDSFWRLSSVPVPKPPKIEDDQWKKTDSGLEYAVMKEGEGDSPRMGQVVTAEYAGWLDDGTIFDTSMGGDAAQFQLGRVIDGWNEGLQLMKPGAHYVFRIPGKLAYGDKGVPGRIPPNATLIFEIKLVK
ncbi:MAG: FKBP-type peptidyl-prolyl cis-trans isomerase [Planctomycetota bacterium]